MKTRKFALSSIARSIIYWNEFTDSELQTLPAGSVFVFDSECYVNFFFVAFKHVDSGKVVLFELSPAATLNTTKLMWMMWRFCLVGFNSKNYDMPMLALACTGADNKALKTASDVIITENLFPYHFEKRFKVQIPKINYIDLIEVAPLQGSLKLYAARMHCERLQDLPIEPGAILVPEEAEALRQYCVGSDLPATQALYLELKASIDLRESMSEQYGVDLRSKSDAQVAEAVINTELKRLTGEYPHKTEWPEGATIRYQVPDYVQFRSERLNKIVRDIAAAEFALDGLGSPVWPKGLGEREDSASDTYVLKVALGKSVYKLGMGGLHSSEKQAFHKADDDNELADNDVESFYPRIIINQMLCPEHLGQDFLTVYNEIVERRIAAKKSGDKATADSLKITINGSFGKLGNKYSTLYAPQLMLQVTISGQLSLLMLIEMLEDAGISVVSGNTDGIVSKYPKTRRGEVRAIIAEWERITNFKTEETLYAWTASRDVNNYYAAKLKDGKIVEIKTKGVYSDKGSALNSRLSKNPEYLICSDAVQAFLWHGIPIAETIRNSTNFTRFLSVKNVKGGGCKGDVYLGKVVRWYYAKGETGFIEYAASGNKVGKSDNAKPIMDLPKEMPNDIDFDWYVAKAEEILYEIGYWRKPETMSLFN